MDRVRARGSYSKSGKKKGDELWAGRGSVSHRHCSELEAGQQQRGGRRGRRSGPADGMEQGWLCGVTLKGPSWAT